MDEFNADCCNGTFMPLDYWNTPQRMILFNHPSQLSLRCMIVEKADPTHGYIA